MKKDNSHLLLVLQSAENNFITFSLHLSYLPFHVKNFTEMLKHLGGGVGHFWEYFSSIFSSGTTKDHNLPSTKSEPLGLNFKILSLSYNYREVR